MGVKEKYMLHLRELPCLATTTAPSVRSWAWQAVGLSVIGTRFIRTRSEATAWDDPVASRTSVVGGVSPNEIGRDDRRSTPTSSTICRHPARLGLGKRAKTFASSSRVMRLAVVLGAPPECQSLPESDR